VDRCTEHERLRRLVSEGTVLVGPMADPEVRQAVTGPAAYFSLAVEPALVEQVAHDVRTQPAALPLMSTACSRRGNTDRVTAHRRCLRSVGRSRRARCRGWPRPLSVV
jgi:hypothetical protein